MKGWLSGHDRVVGALSDARLSDARSTQGTLVRSSIFLTSDSLFATQAHV